MVLGVAASSETDRIWRDRIDTFRNKLVADARFQKWAAAFPLTRPIARRHARALFDLSAGFVYSQVLSACIDVRLFDLLADQARSVEEIAQHISLPSDRTERLLRAAASLKLVSARRNGHFALGPRGAALMAHPGLVAMIRHHTALYADLADPVELLSADAPGTATARYWPYAGNPHPEQLAAAEVSPYTALMAASQELVAGEIFAAYRFDRHRSLLDVGGGDGTFLMAALRRAPHLRATLFDLPAVAKIAAARIGAAGLSGVVRTVSGNIFTDPLPAGADLVSLVRIIHDHDDEAALQILANVRRAVASEGTVLVCEPMTGAAGAGSPSEAYFSFYLMAMGSGQQRSPAELSKLLERTGFTRIRRIRTRVPLLVGLIVASP